MVVFSVLSSCRIFAIVVLILLCQYFWPGGVQPGGVVLCIVLYSTPIETYVSYAKQRRLVTLVSDQIRRREKNTSLMVAILSQIVEFCNGESALHVQHIRILTECILERMNSHTEHYHLTDTTDIIT